ncbi:MAG: hypothetical protein FJZ96_02995, partial [Chloroflexi bacterium]|nr:hypothetical protein [Chloroflexota bacterium]
MPRKKRPEDLSEQELRRLLLDKRRSSRHARLERFRRTGRVVNLAPDLPPASLDEWRTQPLLDGDAPDTFLDTPRPPRRRWLDRLLVGVEVLAVLG